MTTSKLTRLTWLVPIGALILTACAADGSNGSGPDGTVDPTSPAAQSEPAGEEADTIAVAAEEEGSLTIYSSQAEDVLIPLVEAFERAHPEIDAEPLRLTAGDLAARWAGEAESGANVADVVLTAAPNVIVEMADEFEDMNDSLVPALADWPSEFVKDKWVESTIIEQIITYNTDNVSDDELPDTWEDLASDEWAGRVMLSDPRATPVYMSWANLMRQEYGDDYLEAIADLEPTMTESGVTGSQQVAAGAYDLAFPTHRSHNKDLRDEGAPVGIHTVEDVNHGFPMHTAIPIDAPNPNAARVFVDWYLTDEAQQIACGEVMSPVHTNFDNCPELPDSYVPATFDIDEAEQAELLGLLGLE